MRKYNDLIPYLEHAIVIDLNEIRTEPSKYIEEIHRKTSTVFTGLEFDSLSYKTEIDKKESFEDFTSYNLITTINQKENTYIQKSFFNPEKQNQPQESMAYTGADAYYEIFNKMLADQNSKYRLHAITINKKQFGIIALTQTQFEKFNWTYNGAIETYVPVSYENYSYNLTQNRIKKVIKIYDSIGLFSELSQEEKDSCYKEVLQSEINNYDDILKLYKNIVFDIDLEYGVDNKQYEKITNDLMRISRNNFAPVDTIDTYNYDKNKNFDYGFKLSNKIYKTKLSQQEDWLDTGFWNLIQTAVAEQDKTGKFYEIFPTDGLTVVYLTTQQYNLLKTENLLEFSGKDD